MGPWPHHRRSSSASRSQRATRTRVGSTATQATSDSHYQEGESISYRTRVTGLSVGAPRRTNDGLRRQSTAATCAYRLPHRQERLADAETTVAATSRQPVLRGLSVRGRTNRCDHDAAREPSCRPDQDPGRRLHRNGHDWHRSASASDELRCSAEPGANRSNSSTSRARRRSHTPAQTRISATRMVIRNSSSW